MELGKTDLVVKIDEQALEKARHPSSRGASTYAEATADKMEDAEAKGFI